MTNTNPEKEAFDRAVAEKLKASTDAGKEKLWSKLTQIEHIGFKALLGAVAASGLYLVAGQLSGRVNNDPLNSTPPTNGSAIVQTFADSVTRDLNAGWCPSASFLSPSHMRTDMCAFQEGEQQIYIRVANDLYNHLTRQGNLTKADPLVAEIQRAFNRDNHWSFFSGSSTYDQYWQGVGALKELQTRHIEGTDDNAILSTRIDNLGYTVQNLASIVGSEDANLGASEGYMWGFLGSRSDYYHALGTMSATCNFLKAAQSDFSTVINYQSSTGIFKQAVDEACSVVGKKPLIVFGYNQQSLGNSLSHLNNYLQTIQNGLAAQGFANPSVPGPKPNPALQHNR